MREGESGRERAGERERKGWVEIVGGREREGERGRGREGGRERAGILQTMHTHVQCHHTVSSPDSLKVFLLL